MNSRRRVNSNVMRARFAIPLSLVFIALALVLSVATFYHDVFGSRAGFVDLLIPSTVLLWSVGFALPLVVDFIIGFLSSSRRQLLLYVLAAGLLCEIAFLWLDWSYGRFMVSWWLRENATTYPRAIFFRFVFPAAAVALGGLFAVVKRRLSFALHARHA
jgi:hypothetical protein